MNDHTTHFLANDHISTLHAEADAVRLARLARSRDGETGQSVVSRLVTRMRSIGAGEQPAPSITTRHAA